MAYPYVQPYGRCSPPAYSGYSAGHPSTRTYYFIRSRLNGFVLDVQGNDYKPGARVITYAQKPGNCDNQLWYDDLATGTIRSKLNDFCIDWDGSKIVLRPHYPGSPSQQWERSEMFIRNRVTPNKVLDIANGKRASGAHLVSWDMHGNPNQCFDFHFVGAPPPAPCESYKYAPPVPPSAAPPARRYFYIVSDMHKKVLDIEQAVSTPGAKVIVWPMKSGGDCRNQWWYFDESGIIRSALNDFALSATYMEEGVRTMPFTHQPQQQWRVMGNRIMKNDQECLDIAGESKADGASVIAYPYKGSVNQHWHLLYV